MLKRKIMDQLLNWNVEKGIKLSSNNIGGSDNLDCYPLYMAMFL